MNLGPSDILKLGHASAFNFDAFNLRNFKGISTDSRTLKPDELFFAIRGEKFDGHDHVTSAFKAGAACAVVDTFADRRGYLEKPVLVVRDSIKAYGELASNYRDKFQIPIIAVAGSNGKTTTKEMIANVLGAKYNVLSTAGNLNNQIGVPQTLFSLKGHHEIGVVEIGTNHFGEIRYLCEILKPSHGIITNIGGEHLEFFIDEEGVARAEGELFDWLNVRGVAFVNMDDHTVKKAAKRVKNRISYGFSDANADFRGEDQGFDRAGLGKFSVGRKGKKPFEVALRVPGIHMVRNALCAAAVGLEFGVSEKLVSRELSRFKPVRNRMEVFKAGSVTIINDTYNANADSVISALETMKAMKCNGKKIVILGDMLELGASSEREHRKVGTKIDQAACDFLLTFGEMSKIINEQSSVKMKYHYDQKNILAEFASELISRGDLVLVKGSRGMKMEDVVVFLSERLKEERR